MPCFGQQFVDVPLGNLGGEQTIVERLKRAEVILDTITKDISPGIQGAQHDGESRSAVLGEAASIQEGLIDPRRGERELGNTIGTASDNVANVPPLHKHRAKRHDYGDLNQSEICFALQAGLPSQEDVGLIIGTGMAIVFVQGIVNHYGEDLQPTSLLATLPAVSSHPVLLARKLLYLALCMQRLDPSLQRGVLKLGKCPVDAMWSYFNLASNMVTCHEELLDSIEGVECLLYESMYLINSGNLRRALVSIRRASTLAQFMGLHRGVTHERLKRYDSTTNVSGSVAWTRITYLEKFLTLLLGLPTATPRARATSNAMSGQESTADWFERKQIYILERLVERSQERNYDDQAAMREIDDGINRMASEMPAKWWAPIDISQSTNHKDVLVKIISAQLQVVHYNLLIVLHLPYLLRDESDSRFAYNKTTCIYASREVLTRWIAFRSTVKVVLCCRPVDFCAFTAALALLLAYLASHSQRQESAMLLTHQRLGDRALIESALEMMNELNALNGDELSGKMAELTRKLLDLEAECARSGQRYRSSSVDEHENTSDVEHAFHLQIPYFGTVKLETSSASERYSTWSHEALAQQANPGDSSQLWLSFYNAFSHIQPPFPSGPGYQHEGYCQVDVVMPDVMASASDWAFQGVDTAFFNALLSANPDSQVTDDEAWSSYMLPEQTTNGFRSL
ncbi:fungal specific transcription factor domain-containing protein [Aspergillus undulatus]|uniref:fungal specific transcription factor domain-containing protein n=1 Tax=Aspergillus undulatus TaxID=1810928 RepID=UPI003CCDEE9E